MLSSMASESLKKYLSFPCLINENVYKKVRNKLNHLLRIAKRKYYEGKLENAKSNTKNTWKILNEVLNKKRRPRKLPSNFAVDNQNISDPLEIANCFCDYFTIGPNLAKTFPITSNSYKSFLTGNFVDSIFLDLTTEPEIINIVKSLRSGIAAGYDKISIWSVKDSSTLISSPLAHP